MGAFLEGTGPGVDVGAVDVDPVRRPGTRRAEADVPEAAEPVSRGPGRPSLSALGQRSPAMSVRLSVSSRERLVALASKQRRRTSELLREAVDEYLARHED